MTEVDVDKLTDEEIEAALEADEDENPEVTDEEFNDGDADLFKKAWEEADGDEEKFAELTKDIQGLPGQEDE